MTRDATGLMAESTHSLINRSNNSTRGLKDSNQLIKPGGLIPKVLAKDKCRAPLYETERPFSLRVERSFTLGNFLT